MDNTVLSTYIRTRRREWGLTQHELAQLLGCKSREHVSRIENGKGMPGIELAIACEVLFEHSLGELFPSLYKKVRRRVGSKLHALHKKADPQVSVRGIRKKVIIQRAIGRITN